MSLRNFEDGSEIVVEDFNAIPKSILREIYDRFLYEMLQRTENAFFGDGFLVSYATANSVIVKKGLGFQTDLTQTSPEPQRRPLVRPSDITVNISAPDSSNDRIDIVCVKAALVDELTGSRKVKDAISDSISTQNLVVQKDWQAEILVVDGTPSVTPVAPATPAGYVKIAQLDIQVAVGLTGSGDVTDSRDLMPVGGDVVLSTLGYDRITASASTPLSTIIADIDAFLKNGYFENFELDVLLAVPSTPAASKVKIYYKDSTLYIKDETGVSTPVGSGGGGGGSLKWFPPSSSGANTFEENGMDLFTFVKVAEETQKLSAFVKVPEGYIAGRQVILYIGAYSPAAANQFKLQAVTTLIRQNNDAITSTTNQQTANSGDLTNTIANQFRKLTINLSSLTGTVNGVAINAGDILKVELTRIAPTGTDDTEDLRFIPNSTEVKF